MTEVEIIYFYNFFLNTTTPKKCCNYKYFQREYSQIFRKCIKYFTVN